MASRTPTSIRSVRRVAIALKVVVCKLKGGSLGITLLRAEGGAAPHSGRWSLPGAWHVSGAHLDPTAVRIVSDAMGCRPAWISQVGAFDQAGSPSTPSALTVAYVCVVSSREGYSDRTTSRQFSTAHLPPLPRGQKALIFSALASLRSRLHNTSVAFRFLAPTFTLSELQAAYEILLERRVHKASFRRSLRAARLVSPTGEWRVDGPGRPAQLFCYSPATTKTGQQNVRFEIGDRLGFMS